MEIISHTTEGRHELRLKGRLDANWADHVGSAIESAIRAGHHHIDLDLADVAYLSSAGIRVLLKYHKQLKSAHGALRVVRPIKDVLSVLELSGFGMLVAEAKAAAQTKPQTAARRWETSGVKFESHEQAAGQRLEGRLYGQPEKFASGQLSAADCSRLRFDAEMIGLGLGAFGEDPADCRARFGEFLAVGGAAVSQHSDGSSVPDFQLAEGQFVPEVNVLYGLSAAGGFPCLLRFEAAAAEGGVITLASLVEAALQDIQATAAGFVVVAESFSLVGATLQKSPALANGQSPWNFPVVRDWLSFSTERNDERHLALIVGFAERQPRPGTGAFLRPIGQGTNAQGHFHAASFGYRPLPKGNVGLRETIANLLASESARAVMHLLADEREFEGVGQTELMRGACWVSPIQSFSSAPQT